MDLAKSVSPYCTECANSGALSRRPGRPWAVLRERMAGNRRKSATHRQFGRESRDLLTQMNGFKMVEAERFRLRRSDGSCTEMIKIKAVCLNFHHCRHRS